jgi:hypothetical protein
MAFIRRLSDEGAPPLITRQFIKQKSDIRDYYTIFQTLEYLGLVDEEGHPTNEFRVILSNPDESGAWKYVIERAYTFVFDKIDISKASRDEITEVFSTENPTTAPTTARKAAALFISLASMAGFSIAQQSTPRKRGRPRKQERPAQESQPMTISSTDPTKRIDFGDDEHLTITYRLDRFSNKPQQQKLLDALVELVREYENGLKEKPMNTS